MTEELKKQAIAEDAAVAETVEETGATPGWTKPPRRRSARLAAALYEENERAEDERARAEAERMRDVDDEDEDETPRDTGRRCAACGARPPATIGASISCSRASCSMSSLTPRRRLTAPA